MNNRLTVTLTALLLAVPGLANAELSYNWIEVGYESVDVKLDTNGNVVEEDAEGWRMAGSVDLHGPFSLLAEYRYVETDAGSTAVSNGDGNLLSTGPMFRHAITDSLHTLAALTYELSDFTFSGNESRAEGYGLSLGVRGAPCDHAELSAIVSYINYKNGLSGSGSRLQLGALKHLGNGFSASLRYEVNRFESKTSSTDTDFGTAVLGLRWTY